MTPVRVYEDGTLEARQDQKQKPLKRLYLAGPMRGYPEFNFPEFRKATRVLRDRGYEVWSPHERDTMVGFDPTGLAGTEDLDELNFDLPAAVADDVYAIAHLTDAIALLPGWETSSGVRAELAVAAALGKPVGTVTAHLEFFPLKPAAWFLERWGKAGEPASGATATVTQGSEVRITSETGGQKGQKLAQYGLIPAGPLRQVAEVYGFGAQKYDAHNWRKGYDWRLAFDALMRHAWAFWNGEDRDPESGLHHLAHAVFHCFSLIEFGAIHPEFDTRPSTTEGK